jgi:hypothetical protein
VSPSVWAYARCEFDPGPDAMASYEAAALNLVDVFYPDQLTHYLWAGTCLRYRPTPIFLVRRCRLTL